MKGITSHSPQEHGESTSDTSSSGKSDRRFNITLKNMGRDATFDALFVKAKERWEKVIVKDLVDIPAQDNAEHDWFDGVFGNHSAINVPVDDVLIGYSVTRIDGIPFGKNILGQAKPVYIRLTSTQSAPTVSGIMLFDIDDFRSMNASDIELVITHEMGHILGLGKHLTWFCASLCRDFAYDVYQCDGAKREYNSYLEKYHTYQEDELKRSMHSDEDKISNLNTTLRQSPEDGKVLRLSMPDCSHWHESSFNTTSSSELMTPKFDRDKYQPLSRVSVAALEDIGYYVDYNAADPWLFNQVDRNLSSRSDGESRSIQAISSLPKRSNGKQIDSHAPFLTRMLNKWWRNRVTATFETFPSIFRDDGIGVTYNIIGESNKYDDNKGLRSIFNNNDILFPTQSFSLHHDENDYIFLTVE